MKAITQKAKIRSAFDEQIAVMKQNEEAAGLWCICGHSSPTHNVGFTCQSTACDCLSFRPSNATPPVAEQEQATARPTPKQSGDNWWFSLSQSERDEIQSRVRVTSEIQDRWQYIETSTPDAAFPRYSIVSTEGYTVADNVELRNAQRILRDHNNPPVVNAFNDYQKVVDIARMMLIRLDLEVSEGSDIFPNAAYRADLRAALESIEKGRA